MKLLERLGGEPIEAGEWRFTLGEDLHGAFGGANGGVLAAAALAASRPMAPGRIPAGLDARFVRGLGAGTARLAATLLHEGRSLSCVSADIRDERGKLCTRATITLVTPEALEPLDHPGEAGAPGGWISWEAGRPWLQGPVRIPLIETFAPRQVGADERGIATAVRVLWDEPGTVAEAACIAADISVGPPVMRVTKGKPVPIPNPDISLRFCAEPPLPETIVGCARLERVTRGLASTRIEVWTGPELVAVGVSTTTLLAGAWPNASAARTG